MLYTCGISVFHAEFQTVILCKSCEVDYYIFETVCASCFCQRLFSPCSVVPSPLLIEAAICYFVVRSIIDIGCISIFECHFGSFQREYSSFGAIIGGSRCYRVICCYRVVIVQFYCLSSAVVSYYLADSF